MSVLKATKAGIECLVKFLVIYLFFDWLFLDVKIEDLPVLDHFIEAELSDGCLCLDNIQHLRTLTVL